MRRHELSDKQWARLAPLLPPQRPRTGRPARDHRTVVHGILWVLRTGAPWRSLPERYGPWQTASSRFHRWPFPGRASTPPGQEGGRRGLGPEPRGLSTKGHLRTEGGGKSLAIVLTGGARHELAAVGELLRRGAVRWLGRGRPRLRPGDSWVRWPAAARACGGRSGGGARGS